MGAVTGLQVWFLSSYRRPPFPFIHSFTKNVAQVTKGKEAMALTIESEVARLIVKSVGILGIVGTIGVLVYVAWNQLGITIALAAGLAVIAFLCGVAINIGEPEKAALEKLKQTLKEKCGENEKIIAQVATVTQERDNFKSQVDSQAAKLEKMEADLKKLMENMAKKPEEIKAEDKKEAKRQAPPPPEEKTAAT